MEKFEVRQISAEQLGAQMWAFVALLQDSVDSGASVGFLPPLDAHAAVQYWNELIYDLQDG